MFIVSLKHELEEGFSIPLTLSHSFDHCAHFAGWGLLSHGVSDKDYGPHSLPPGSTSNSSEDVTYARKH